MKKKIVCLFAAFALLLTACNLIVSYNVSEVNLDLGLKQDYRIVYVNDLHLQAGGEEIAPDKKDTVDARISEFTSNGFSTEMRMTNFAEAINQASPNFVILGGDILDCCSEKNCELLKESLSKVKAPLIYLRSDHDIEPYWLTDTDPEKCRALQEEICDNSPIFINDLGEIVVLGINYSYRNISEESLATIKETFEKGKPVIVATHVPFSTGDDTSLQTFSEERRDGRRLIWGSDSEYLPDENMQEFLDLIYAEDSPVVAVLAAHLHNEWEGNISDNAIEHIFTPCYEGNIGIINIH